MTRIPAYLRILFFIAGSLLGLGSIWLGAWLLSFVLASPISWWTIPAGVSILWPCVSLLALGCALVELAIEGDATDPDHE